MPRGYPKIKKTKPSTKKRAKSTATTAPRNRGVTEVIDWERRFKDMMSGQASAQAGLSTAIGRAENQVQEKLQRGNLLAGMIDSARMLNGKLSELVGRLAIYNDDRLGVRPPDNNAKPVDPTPESQIRKLQHTLGEGHELIVWLESEISRLEEL